MFIGVSLGIAIRNEEVAIITNNINILFFIMFI